MRDSGLRLVCRRATVIIAATAAVALLTWGQTTIHAPFVPPAARRPASAFARRDASGRVIELANYRGKIVILDFWATWCGGCKEELPWFSRLQKNYRSRGLIVIGASVDDAGWNAVKPFLAKNPANYPMVIADAAMQKSYGIGGMPNTFVIDSQGRLAAAYRAGLVNQAQLESYVRALLAGTRNP